MILLPQKPQRIVDWARGNKYNGSYCWETISDSDLDAARTAEACGLIEVAHTDGEGWQMRYKEDAK